MRHSTLLTCEKCGCHFILSTQELPELVRQGIRQLPTQCQYCRTEEQSLLYAEARKNPDKLFRYRCGLCMRIFVSVRQISLSDPDFYACPECTPDFIPYFTDEDRKLNKDLGYPK